MGGICLTCKTEKSIEFKSACEFKNNRGDDILKHVIDIGNDAFARKICKENGLHDINIAYLWIELYKTFMIYLAWQYEEHFRDPATNFAPDRVNYLSLPFEILQVWKLHILYTQNYMVFSKIVTNNKLHIIDFIQPYFVWKLQDISTIQKNFYTNQRFIQALTNYPKFTVNSLFIFQSSYIKNILNYNIYERVCTSRKILERFNQELTVNQLKMLNLEVKNLYSLRILTEQIENVILECCCTCDKDRIPTPSPWKLTEKYSNEDLLNKAKIFQEFEFPENFATSFARHHLVTLPMANLFIDEYRKYLFLTHTTTVEQTPSEETDQVWHYHISFIKEYSEFSNKIMKKRFHHHNPSEGKKSDDVKYFNVYKRTQDYLKDYFDDINGLAWPCSCVRFSQFYKWKSFPHFAVHGGVWNLQFFRGLENKYDLGAVGSGCVNGCGSVGGILQITQDVETEI